MEHKFKIGDRVITKEFRDNEKLIFNPMMKDYIGVKGTIRDINLDGSYFVHNWHWPESALVLVNEPDLAKLENFTKAAMQGLCANSDGVMMKQNYRSFTPENIATISVEIAKATINELNKEAQNENRD